MILFCKNLFALPPYTFTGNFSVKKIIQNGQVYELVTLLSAGTFTAMHERSIQIWMCGGGAGGSMWGGRYSSGGGGGGGEFRQDVIILEKFVPIDVYIGQGGAAVYQSFGQGESTHFGTITVPGGGTTGNGKNGGSGGGGGAQTGLPGSGGLGQGVSSVPFLDTDNFQPHCAGGGGAALNAGPYYYDGGRGGSDGSNGTSATEILSAGGYMAQYGRGGSPGGGDGGIYDSYRDQIIKVGTDATYWGAGGGGGWYVDGTAGRGYQGVIYLLFPA